MRNSFLIHTAHGGERQSYVCSSQDDIRGEMLQFVSITIVLY